LYKTTEQPSSREIAVSHVCIENAFAIVLLALTDAGVQIEMAALRDLGSYLKFVTVVAVGVMGDAANGSFEEIAGGRTSVRRSPSALSFANIPFRLLRA
jgi:hypothetical protein